MNRADRHGNAQSLGPDPFFDDVFLGAADHRYVTAERIVEPGELSAEGPVADDHRQPAPGGCRVETPGGAHFTSCVPDYPRDEEFQRAYVKAAGDPEDLGGLLARGTSRCTETEYQSLTGRRGMGGSGSAGTGGAGSGGR